MPGGRYQTAQRFQTRKRTGGDLTLTSTTWANLSAITSPLWDAGTDDVVLAAAAGDVIRVSANGLWGNEAQSGFLNVGTWTGAAFNSFLGSGEPTTSTGDGIPGWAGISGALGPVGASTFHTVVAGDLVNGFVTLRFRYRVTGSKTLKASTTDPLKFIFENIGPPDPH